MSQIVAQAQQVSVGCSSEVSHNLIRYLYLGEVNGNELSGKGVGYGQDERATKAVSKKVEE